MGISAIVNNLFQEKNGKFFLNGEELDAKIFSILKDEAKYIERSRFWEYFNLAIKQQAFKLGVVDSLEWQHTLFAKTMYQWALEMEKLLHKLTK